MSRTDLTEKQWRALLPDLPTDSHRGHAYRDRHKVLSGILWCLPTGDPWRDIPNRYGPCQACYDRFIRWSRTGRFALSRLRQTNSQSQPRGRKPAPLLNLAS
ncbi:MAG: transposase [Methylotetracoccus sp.]